jgi:DNA-directed RNA polymerase specialized sigma24 family protein
MPDNIRYKGNDPDRALDLTQDFFARLLERDLLATADHRKGRFRSFLRTLCANFLIDSWRRKPDAELMPISRRPRVYDRRRTGVPIKKRA